MEVWIISFKIFLDLGVQARQIRRTHVMIVVIYIHGMQVTRNIPELGVIHIYSHTNSVSITIKFIL